MQIDNTLIAVTKALFSNRDEWNYVTSEQKETFFFIINRYLARKYPQYAIYGNNNNVDRAVILDAWAGFLKTQPYPNWFWKGKIALKSKSIFTPKETNMLITHLNIKKSDLIYLYNMDKEFVEGELKHLKKIEEQYGK